MKEFDAVRWIVSSAETTAQVSYVSLCQLEVRCIVSDLNLLQ